MKFYEKYLVISWLILIVLQNVLICQDNKVYNVINLENNDKTDANCKINIKQAMNQCVFNDPDQYLRLPLGLVRQPTTRTLKLLNTQVCAKFL